MFKRRRTSNIKTYKINGYKYVDLGLPSGLLWAECNVGAKKKSESGYYYQWGAGSTKYSSTDSYYTGTNNTLPYANDTARQVMGDIWRMPTEADYTELKNNTTMSGTTVNGVDGIKFSNTVDGKERYIFFPLCGHKSGSSTLNPAHAYYWLSTQDTSSNKAKHLFGYLTYNGNLITGATLTTLGTSTKNSGYSVRGVHAKLT